MENTNAKINNVKNRLLKLSPAVAAGLEREANKDDFQALEERALGKGGFGMVWKVRHKETKKIYAIKVINKAFIVKENMVDQINREIEIMYKVNHPHIVTLHSHYEDEKNFYLIMQCASKGQLYNKLKKAKSLDERTTAQYIRELIEAVKYLHSMKPPIIHRDIKPENVLLDAHERCLLADFGWSNFQEESSVRDTYCGTPEYLAPEMINKSGHNESIDLWSIGVLTFELLAGRPPFKYNGDHKNLYSDITNLKIKWSNELSDLAKNFVSMILKIKPEERLSLDDMLTHPWMVNTPPLLDVLKNKVMTYEEEMKHHMIQHVEERDSVEETDDLENKRKIKETLRKKSDNDEVESLKKVVALLQEEMEKKDALLNQFKRKASVQHEEDESKRIKENERLDLLMEIEIKNKKIFTLESDISVLQTENNQLERTNKSLTQKIEEQQKKFGKQEETMLETVEKLRQQVLEKEKDLTEKEHKIRLTELNTLETEGNSVENANRILMGYLEELRDLTLSKVKALETKLIEKEEENCKFRLESIQGLSISVEEINSELKVKYKKMLEEERKLRGAGEEASLKEKKNKAIDWYKSQLNEMLVYKNKYMKHEREIEKLTHQLEMALESKSVVEEKNEFFNIHIGSLNDSTKKLKAEKEKYKNAFKCAEELFNKYNKDKKLRELINFSEIYN